MAIFENKERHDELYTLCDKAIAGFLNSAKLDHSEQSFEQMKAIFEEVVNDIGESWYRRSLGK